jgi:hypothetical protein
MTYDYSARKTVVVLANTLAVGAAANVMGHLCVALGARISTADLGKHPLVDGSGVQHMGISRYPVIVTTVKPTRLRQFITEARNAADLLLADYPEEMLTTDHDDELAAQLANNVEESLTYLGAAAHGSNATLSQLSGKFMLYGKT